MHQTPSVFVALWQSPLTRPSGTLSPTGRGDQSLRPAFFWSPSPLRGEGSGVRGPAPTQERIEAGRPIAVGPTYHHPRVSPCLRSSVGLRTRTPRRVRFIEGEACGDSSVETV